METNKKTNENSEQLEAVFKDKTILVVDDVKVNYLLIKAMLMRTGACIVWAEDGFKDLDILSSEINVDVVLMDFNMPVMDGLETTIRIKRIKSDLPVLSQSTYTDSPLFDRAHAPFDAYITKPILPKSLIEEISKFVF